MDKQDKNIRLDELPKHNIYKVPENYFDRLPMQVMERTAGADKQERAWQPSLWRNLRLAIAPMVLLLVFVGVYFFGTNMTGTDTTSEQALSSLAEQEIFEYLNTSTELESADFAGMNVMSGQDLTADFLNVSATSAEEELEYYHIKNLEY